MELMLLHPDLRRQWLQSYARSLRRRFLEPDAGQAPKVIAMLHQSPATRNLAQKIIGRLQRLGEAVSVLSDADSWRSIPDVRFRSLLDGNRLIEVAEIRRQMAEWNQAKRIVVDITAAQNLDWAVLLRPADCALVFIRPREVGPAIERLRALDLASQGWLDKIAIVWAAGGGQRRGARSTGSPRVREPGIQNLRIAASASLGQGAFRQDGAPGPLPAGCQHRRGPGRRGCPRHGAPGCAQSPRSEWHRPRCDRRHERWCDDRDPLFRGSGLRLSAKKFAADLKLPWIFRQLPSGGYWYLLYKYRRGQFEPMLRKYLHDWKLEQLAVPCLAVTVDLVSGHAVVRDRGDAVNAILESINLPMLSAPICRNGQALIDGGLVNNIPADVLTSQDCNFLIAVSVTAKIAEGVWRQQAGHADAQDANSVKPANVLPHPRSAEFQPQQHRRRPAEVVIEPEVVDFDLSEFMRAKELSPVGEQAAIVQMAKIQQLLARLDPGLFRFAQ